MGSGDGRQALLQRRPARRRLEGGKGFAQSELGGRMALNGGRWSRCGIAVVLLSYQFLMYGASGLETLKPISCGPRKLKDR